AFVQLPLPGDAPVTGTERISATSVALGLDSGLLDLLTKLEQEPWNCFLYAGLSERLFQLAAKNSNNNNNNKASAAEASAVLQLAARAGEACLPMHKARRSDADSHTRLVFRRAIAELEAFVFPAKTKPWLASPRLTRAEPVHVMISCFGAYGAFAGPTLRSLFLHRSAPLHMYVVGDSPGHQSVQALVARLPSHLTEGVAWEFVSLWEDRGFLGQLARLPPQCLHTFMGHSAFARGVFIHNVLRDVKRVIYMDIGDVLVFADIVELWDQFELFSEAQLVGIASENGVGMKQGYHYGGAEGEAWINTGILLLDLEKQRKGHFELELLRTAWAEEKACALADMSLLGWLLQRNPDWRYHLSSLWHYMPSAHWKASEYDVSWVNRSWPPELRGLQLFPGLLGPSDMEHPCPMWYEVLGEATNALAYEHTANGDKGRETIRLMVEDSKLDHLAPNPWNSDSFTADCTCGARVRLVHFVSRYKWLPWARKLLAYWGDGDPPPPVGQGSSSKYARSQLAVDSVGLGDRLVTSLCEVQLQAQRRGLAPKNQEECESEQRLQVQGRQGKSCHVGNTIRARYPVNGEYYVGRLAQIRQASNDVVVDWRDGGSRARVVPLSDVFVMQGNGSDDPDYIPEPAASDIPCTTALTYVHLDVGLPGSEASGSFCAPAVCLAGGEPGEGNNKNNNNNNIKNNNKNNNNDNNNDNYNDNNNNPPERLTLLRAAAWDEFLRSQLLESSRCSSAGPVPPELAATSLGAAAPASDLWLRRVR
ncbi:unnamed protein product, partial [Polarella glacialis]